MGRHKLEEKLFDKNENNIANFITKIQDIFPILKSNYNIDMFAERPVSQRPTAITYTGKDNKDTRILLEFNSNYKENNTNLLGDNELFCTVFYGFAGNKAGVINLNDSNECAEIIYSALYELGFRTQADIDTENNEKEQEKQAKLQAEKEKQAKRKAELQAELNNKESNDTNDEDTLDDEEFESSLVEGKEMFDKYLKALKNLDTMNSKIMVNLALPSNDNSYKILNIDLTYVTPTVCLVETTGINPKVDKTTKWESAEDYIFKVANKLKAVMSVTAIDDKGKDIEISDETPVDDVNVDLDL